MSPLLVLFAMAAGRAVGGILRALAAVPLAGALEMWIVLGADLADQELRGPAELARGG
jgi:predicted PurR-regulated permease PerM